MIWLLYVPLPLRLPVATVQLVWHSRFTQDPASRWMRALLIEVCRGLDDEVAGDGRRAAVPRRRGG